jgi:hypothetical protein
VSRLQTALHALPQGSLVSPLLLQSTRALNAHIDATARAEVAAAKQIQAATGCNWAEAIRAARLPG